MEIKTGPLQLQIMEKNKTDLSYKQVVFYALLAEMVLIVFQFLYLKIYINYINPGADFAFTEEYMKGAGFYIFLIVGFFVITMLSFLIFRKSQKQLLDKALIIFITGAFVELLFYNVIPANYEGVFLYSILDKFIAVFFGAIVYYVWSSPEPNTKGV